MKIFIYLSLVALVASAPASEVVETTKGDDDSIAITRDFYNPNFKIYTGENEIVKLYFPLNEINAGEEMEDLLTGKTLFFVEAGPNGENKGISILINGKATHLLTTGTSVAFGGESTKIAYLGASDGLYIYKAEQNKVEKYGTFTDSIIDMAKDMESDEMYVLTAKNEVYKVSDNGMNKELIAAANGAKEIVVDNEKNLYFIDEHNHVKVLTTEGVRLIEGLPVANKLELIDPAFVMEKSVPIVVGDKMYFVYSNGTVEFTDVTLDVAPSAIAIEPTVILYLAREKTIYEYNIIKIMMMSDEFLSEIKEFLNEKTNEVDSLSKRSKVKVA